MTDRPPLLSPLQSLQIILQIGFAGSLKAYLGIGIAALVAGGFAALVPLFLKQLVDAAVIQGQGGDGDLLLPAAIMAAAVLGLAVIRIVRDVALSHVERSVDLRLMPALWQRQLAAPDAFGRNSASGDVHVRMLGAEQVRASLIGLGSGIGFGLLTAIPLTLTIATLSPVLAWISLALALAPLVFVSLIRRAYLARTTEMLEHEASVSAFGLGSLNSVAFLRVAAKTSLVAGLWLDRLGEQLCAYRDLYRFENTSTVALTVFPGFAVLCAAMLALSIPNSISVGDFASFTYTVTLLFATISGVTSACYASLSLIPALNRIAPLLTIELAPPQPANGLSGTIQFDRVGFAYPDTGEPVFENLSLRVEPGEFVGIVGPSDVGKSTILRLMLGLEQPDSGAVRIDGHSLADLRKGNANRQFGVVLQGEAFFPSTIAEAVSHNGLYTEPEVWHALDRVELGEEIRALPMGLATPVGSDVDTLSGGQKQRLGLARAVVGSPVILFLDEATSALDRTMTERIGEMLAGLDMTRIVVSQSRRELAGATRLLEFDGRSLNEIA